MSFYIEINPDYCKGCKICIPECPKGLIETGKDFNNKGWQYAVPKNLKECTGCKKCATVCPDAAINVYREVL